jgi:transcriptional regulator with XRE-family HTH domain
MDDRLTAFARALETEMSLARLNQTQLAGRAGLSQGVISSWLLQKTSNPDPQSVFATERAMNLRGGRLSRHLGFMPVPADDRAPKLDLIDLIEHDPDLRDPLDREAVASLYRVLRRRGAPNGLATGGRLPQRSSEDDDAIAAAEALAVGCVCRCW